MALVRESLFLTDDDVETSHAPGLCIVDEAHKYRTGGAAGAYLKKLADNSGNILLLTATPVVTNPEVSSFRLVYGPALSSH